MAQRRALIRYYAGLKKRVADPAWPGGTLPTDWMLDGATHEYDQDAKAVRQVNARSGLRSLTYGEAGTAYVAAAPTAANPTPDVRFAVVATETADYLHLRMWRVRMSELPSRHDLTDGTTTPIELTDSQGIAEAGDYVFFKNTSVVGVLVNRAGPSQAEMLSYLEEKAKVNMRLAPLTREDALDLVRGELVLDVEVEVIAGHFEALATIDDDLGSAATNVDTPGLRTIRVSMGAERSDREQFWNWWRPRARRLADLGRAQVRRLAVTQSSDGSLHSHILDLLEQTIGLEVDVPIEAGRTIDPTAARDAIVSGYNTNNELIRRAADLLDAGAENQRTERKKPRRAQDGEASL